MKDSFILYISYWEHIKALDMVQRGQLLTAIFKHQMGEPFDELDDVTKMCFSFIRQRLDVDSDAYAKKCKTNKQNIQKRWEATQEKPDTNVYERIRSDTKVLHGIKSYSDNDNEYDNEYDNDNEGDIERKKKRKKAAKPQWVDTQIASYGFSPELEQTVKDWVQYKTEKRQGYQETGLKSFLTRVRNEAEKLGERKAIDCMINAMGNNWQGVVWDERKYRSESERIANRVKDVSKWILV